MSLAYCLSCYKQDYKTTALYRHKDSSINLCREAGSGEYVQTVSKELREIEDPIPWYARALQNYVE